MNFEKRKVGINEVLLPIDGFPNYEVSNYGNVNIRRQTNKHFLDTKGYCSIYIMKEKLVFIYTHS